MKKSKILVVGLIGLLLAGGLFLVSCNDDSGGGCPVGDCFYNDEDNYRACYQDSCALHGNPNAKCNC
jgi:hypothetical protein